MIDARGYRHNVCMVVINDAREVLLAKRRHQRSWQLPQGGVDEGENALDAMWRELYEEVGLTKEDVSVIARTDNWLYYDIPKTLQRKGSEQIIGQKQLWFLLKLSASGAQINLNCGDIAEFDDWRWVDYWQPIDEAIDFKKSTYEDALKALASVVFDNHYAVPNQYRRRLNCSYIRLDNLNNKSGGAQIT